MSGVVRLDRVVLSCADALQLAHFYEGALGFSRTCVTRIVDPALGELLGVPGASAQGVRLALGGQELDLAQFTPRGHAYPAGVTGTSGFFQHFAMEVENVDLALNRLRQHSGWKATSVGGPQLLPAASGAVTAFKFQDPEGHPLELITTQAPALRQLPRIGHSAISVASVPRSIAFYQALGFKLTGASLNIGPEQAQLDGIPHAQVAVSALAVPHAPPPHLELLCYGSRFVPASPAALANDIVATWLVLTVRDELGLSLGEGRLVRFSDGYQRKLIRDPDGHWLCLELPPQPLSPP